ncbi:relaxase/mobilization nuclease domain-containing protein [Sphingobium aquiterrae]|uniref:relaxase/mobilization nuclease domain-containing protein n=1 Tax=Sphingobium aquiterrae TaxID=2038656 RepID=UPI0030196E21
MNRDEQSFDIRPGRARDRGAGQGRRVVSLATQVRRAAAKAGHMRLPRARRSGGTGTIGRGRLAAASVRFRADGRKVVIKARIVRHKGTRFRAAPLARHIDYLARDGVTRDGQDARLFDQRSDRVEAGDFARRCEDDRHHFRFIVSPQDGADMEDLRGFARDLMADMARDLDTRLDWVGVDHWNTDNPHVHILLRGRTDDGSDLVIDRDYISEGMRARAEARATLELGPRTSQEIARTLAREVDAERWTSLDQKLQRLGARNMGIVDLRPGHAGQEPAQGAGYGAADSQLLLGRAARLERMALAEPIAPAMWTLGPDFEESLRELGMRTDIIKTMHRAMQTSGRRPDLATFTLHDGAPTDPVIGRLSARRLHDELTGTAFAIIEGVDGRTHHLQFEDFEVTGDTPIGGIVELRSWTGRDGRAHMSLATRSDMPLHAQVDALGATWIDRQLVADEPLSMANGFGREVRDALDARREKLVALGVATRRGGRVMLPSGMIASLRASELQDAATRIAQATGLAHRPSAPGEIVSGQYRERVTLASGRFAMIDDGLGFQLVPWRPALDRQLGSQVLGTMSPGGRIDWSPGRSRGLGL